MAKRRLPWFSLLLGSIPFKVNRGVWTEHTDKHSFCGMCIFTRMHLFVKIYGKNIGYISEIVLIFL